MRETGQRCGFALRLHCRGDYVKITGTWHAFMREKRNMKFKDMAIFLDYRAVEVWNYNYTLLRMVLRG